MKKVLAITVIIVLSLSFFSACGNSSSGNSAASTVDSTKQAEPEKLEPVAISILGPGNASTDKKDFNTEVFPELVKEKFPNVTVNAENLPEEQFRTTLKARMASGEGPDIFYYWPKMQALDVVNPGYAKDITGLSVLSKFNKSIVDAFSVNGKSYGIPSGVNILGVYYNKDLFAKAGIADVPKDWESFMEVCKKLKAAGIQPIISGDKDSYVIQFGIYQLAANLVYPAENDFDTKLIAGSQHFAGSKWVDVLTRYKQLYDEGYIQKNSLGAGNTQAQQMFIDGKAAMTFDGNWSQGNIAKKGAVDFERGFFPLSGNEAGKQLNLCAAPSGGTFINASTENYDTIVKIFEYEYDGSSPLYKAYVEYSAGQIPAYNGLEFAGDKVLQDYYKLFQTNPSWYFCNQAWPTGVSDEICAKFQEVIAGKTQIDDVLKSADAKLTEILSQKN